MRLFIILLLLVVVFLTGLLIGIDREQQTHAHLNSTEPQITEPNEQIIYWEQQEDEPFILEQGQLNMEVTEQGTHKIAAFLEAGVKGFYEVVVEALFQISSLFV